MKNFRKKIRDEPIVETLSSVEGRLGIYSGRSLIFGICGVISLNTEGFLENKFKGRVTSEKASLR